MIKQASAIILITAALMTGCGTSTTITAANVDHPVLFGKIRSIQNLECEQVPIRIPLNISHFRRKQYIPGTMIVNAGNRVDAELLRLIESPNDIVMINEIYFGSTSSAVIGPSSYVGDDSWVDIVGGIYRAPSGEYDPK